jgi:hypothetical protein
MGTCFREKASHQNKDADLVAGIRTIVFITYFTTNLFIISGVVRHWNSCQKSNNVSMHIEKNFLEYKKTLKCQHCGIDDHRILEFHHLRDKDHNISNMVNHGYAWKRIEKEIVKCILLCCNCHRLEHWAD